MPNISDSFINSLMGLFPNITREENIHLVNRLGFTSDRMGSKTLYNIWRDQDNKISETLYKRPVTISDDEVQKMEKAGLVRQIANNLEVTEKGKNAIKVMVLGNDASIFNADVKLMSRIRADLEIMSFNRIPISISCNDNVE